MADDPLLDPDTSWWAKYHHAQTHIDRLRDACDEYDSRQPVEVRAEPTTNAGETAYRFHQSEPIPVAISLIVGDVLHNLRSALDSLMVGLVGLDLGRELDEADEKACQFPISADPKAFDEDLRRPKARGLVSQRVEASLREAQPFRILETFKAMKVERADVLAYEQESRFHNLSAIQRLSNIDKHRRVSVTQWWPSIVFWSGDADKGEYRWHPNRPPYVDGQIIGYMRGTGQPPDQVIHNFTLILPEAPYHQPERYYASGSSLVSEAENWRLAAAFCLQTVIGRYGRDDNAGECPPNA